MKRPAKKSGVLKTIEAVVFGVLAGAAAMFLSEKKNRSTVKNTVNKTMRKGRVEVAKAKRTIAATKKKLMRK